MEEERWEFETEKEERQAKEIERLRKALEEIIKYEEKDIMGVSQVAMLRIAQEALKEE